MILNLDVLERLSAKYADPARFRYGWSYNTPSGTTVRPATFSHRQFEPSSWETNYATREPGTAFRVGHTQEKKVELPPLNATAVESDPRLSRRLSGDFGTSEVRPGFVTPGLAASSGRKTWDGNRWRTEVPSPVQPDFRKSDGTVMPRFDTRTPIGALPKPDLPTEAPPVEGRGAGLNDAFSVLDDKARRGVMNQRHGNIYKKVLEQHGLDALKRLYPGALEVR